MPTLAEITAKADEYGKSLLDLKGRLAPAEHWYRYSIISNVHHLRSLLENTPHGSFLENITGARIIDIGGADGDLAFFFESLGCSVDLIDNSNTSWGVQAASRLRDALNSSVSIHDIDLDSQFSLPHARYDLALFLGTLYHLKNPFYALERISHHADHCFISTRIARFTPKGTLIRGEALGYLLDAGESNNDSTNYWIFSEQGLRRLLQRAGWEVLAFASVGDLKHSNPSDNDRDERAFCFLRSTRL
jgi:2-polyprenyl-3-methyl-5-hydroxy-6-metoxy-1,4-benzoquinol methylase